MTVPWAFAQTDDKQETHVGGLDVRAIPSVIHVGDEVRMIIQAEFPKGYSIEPISSKTKLEPFELKAVDKPLVSQRKKRIIQTVILRLTIFKTGDFEIPSIPIAVWNIAGQRAQAATPPIPVHVVSVEKSKTDTADIRPIKTPVSVSLRNFYSGLMGALVFLLALLLVVSIFLRRKKNKKDPESLLPPHERVLLELGRLNENCWLAAGKEREHYSEFSDILRRYLERRYGLEIMEHTSPEIISILKEKKLEGSAVESSREIFEQADLVKFAKLVPERSLAVILEKHLRSILETTKLLPETGSKNTRGKTS